MKIFCVAQVVIYLAILFLSQMSIINLDLQTFIHVGILTILWAVITVGFVLKERIERIKK